MSPPVFPSTCSASTRALRVNICIQQVVGMAAWAVRFRCVQRRETLAAEQILSMSYRFKVRRVYAVMDSAKMIERQPFRDGADDQFIGEPVCVCEIPVTNAELSVVIPLPFSLPACPKPAWAKVGAVVGNGTMLIDLRPKAIFWSHTYPHLSRPLGLLAAPPTLAAARCGLSGPTCLGRKRPRCGWRDS
jgi:hypothetical protein